MKKRFLFFIVLITITLVLSSCEFIIPKTIPLFIKPESDYAWVSPGASITYSIFTNINVSECTIKINNDTITDPKVLSIASTYITYNGVEIEAKKYTLNLSNYSKVSTSDLSFDLDMNVKRGNKILEWKKKVFFGKTVNKKIVNQEDIQSTYQAYQLQNPEILNNLTVISTVIIKNCNNIKVNGSLEINGGSIVFENQDNNITLEPSGTSWNGLILSNNGKLNYGKSKLYIIKAKTGVKITSCNRDYKFENITFNNTLGSKNIGIYNDAQSNITISNSVFYHCLSSVINRGTGELNLENCKINYQNGSLKIYGKTKMYSCTLSNLSAKESAITSEGTSLTFSASPAIVVASDFTMKKCKIENFTLGIYVKTAVSTLNITNNTLEGNTVGILLNANIIKSPNISIEKNIISGKITKISTPTAISDMAALKDCGIVTRNCDGSILSQNKIENYSYGIAAFNNGESQFFSSSNIGNDIINSNIYSQNPANFAYSYWGTSDINEIVKRTNPQTNIRITPIATKSTYN